MLPNKQKQRFPATPGTAVSSLCGNKDTACKVSEPPPTGRMFPLILVVTNMVITTFGKRPSDPMCATGQAGRLYIQTLKTDFQRCRRKFVFACWGSTPDPLNSPLPGLAARSVFRTLNFNFGVSKEFVHINRKAHSFHILC